MGAHGGGVKMGPRPRDQQLPHECKDRKDVKSTVLRLRCASSASILREGLSCSIIETAVSLCVLPGIWCSS